MKLGILSLLSLHATVAVAVFLTARPRERKLILDAGAGATAQSATQWQGTALIKTKVGLKWTHVNVKSDEVHVRVSLKFSA